MSKSPRTDENLMVAAALERVKGLEGSRNAYLVAKYESKEAKS